MAMDFPSNPIDGQISGNYIYSASSGVWKSKPIAGTTTIHSSVMPLSANPGDVWFNTNDGTSFTYFDDGTSRQWVEMISSGVPNVNIIMPTGSVLQTALTAAPTGWLLCQGQAVSRTTYSVLFNAISTTYGIGDGSTTFNLPDLRGRVAIGAGQVTDSASLTQTFTLASKAGEINHTLTSAEMPSHTHTQDAHRHWLSSADRDDANMSTTGQNSQNYGMFADAGSYNANDDNRSTGKYSAYATATNQYTGGNGSHNNLQPYIVLNYMIKT